MRIAFVFFSAALATGCGSMTYRPVQEANFSQLVSEGCRQNDDRFTVTAQINSSSRETIVLWDGYDGASTVAVRLPKQGFGSRMQDKVGSSRYDQAFDQLNTLRESGAPVTLTMQCESSGMAPVADSFSYLENGQRVQFEF